MLPGDLDRHLILLGLAAARSIPLVWMIPAFGGPAMPFGLRLALGLGLSWLCLPLVSGRVPEAPILLWTILAAREVAVGLVMGFICACWFRAAEAAGWLTDALRGTTPAERPSPIGGGRSSPFAALMSFIAVLIFLEIGGIHHVALALARSYEALPVSSLLQVGPHARAAVTPVILASAKLIESALGLCAPILVSLVLADLALGIIGRAVPQIPFYPLVVPLKALLGVGVVLLGLGGIEAAMQGSLADFLALVRAATALGR